MKKIAMIACVSLLLLASVEAEIRSIDITIFGMD